MTTELTKAAQQALEALDEIHAGKRHPQLALAVAHNLRRALTHRPAAQTEREADTGPRVLREVFGLCEDTIDKMAAENTEFSRGRAFEAKGISRALGTWFQDEYCGRSYMGEPSLPAPQQATPAQEVHPLASRCYAMSEPHLSGYRLVLGFETLEAVDAAHTWVANVRKAPQQATPERHLTVTTNQQGEAVMVSWQDDEHRILEVVWERKQATPEPWCPDVCPITGLPFFMWIEHHKTGQMVPTYGGPYDSYTIPVRDADGSYCRERYDHDRGGWLVGEVQDVGVQIVSDQAYVSDEPPATPEPVGEVALALAAAQQSFPNPDEPEANWCLLERKHVEVLCMAAKHGTRPVPGVPEDVQRALDAAMSACDRIIDQDHGVLGGIDFQALKLSINRGLAALVKVAPADVLRDAERYRAINTPEIEDFLAAVHNEALHQRERWGSDQDAGKADADWLWLLGYLAGKALHAQTDEKRLHHIITTAAACLNWHAARVGAWASMRPGIDPAAHALAAAQAKGGA